MNAFFKVALVFALAVNSTSAQVKLPEPMLVHRGNCGSYKIKNYMYSSHAQGGGIESVRLKIRRLVDDDIKVRIPIGVFFVSRRASTQNMVATQEKSVLLTDGEWKSLFVAAACANRPRGIPDSSDSFAVVCGV